MRSAISSGWYQDENGDWYNEFDWHQDENGEYYYADQVQIKQPEKIPHA